MIKSSTLAAAATLALAALPVLALATNANAETMTPKVAVKVADIDTLTPAGAQIFAARVNVAANRFCQKTNPNMRLNERAECKSAVKAEMSDKFEAHNAVLAAAKSNAQVAAR